jgi:hypothetical protein
MAFVTRNQAICTPGSEENKIRFDKFMDSKFTVGWATNFLNRCRM